MCPLTGARPSAATLLEMRGVRKRFPGVIALDGVDLDLRAGEVHVLLGENGAGKSTLMKILSGAHAADEGEILVDGRPAGIDSPKAARRLGISIIYQELTLVPHLSAPANVFLGKEPTRPLGLLDLDLMKSKTRELLLGLGIDLDLDVPVSTLGIAEQQMVEVAKALSEDARILVMDEPTSALTASEISQLFAAIEHLLERGVGIIYISHRMNEVQRIGHRVSVLRDGRRISTHAVADIAIDELIRLMVGRPVGDHFPRRRSPPGDEVLRVDHLSRRGVLHDISFHLRRGEILGVAGLLGAGRTELARALFGADRSDGGQVSVKGRMALVRSPAEGIARGLGLLPEDRKAQGLVLGLSVRENLALSSEKKLSRFGFVQEAKEALLSKRFVDELRIKTPGIEQLVGALSGGNQQKIVLGKWLAASVDVLIMDEPTRGIDVAAKVEIYELMNRLTASGAAILMISSELPEILGMSDRILVMRAGRIASEFLAEGADQEALLGAALGRAS
jgi:ribose transport system ATP-binding protein